MLSRFVYTLKSFVLLLCRWQLELGYSALDSVEYFIALLLLAMSE